MAPKEVVLSNIERMKKAIEARQIRLLCLSCTNWVLEARIRELPERPACGKCGSSLLTSLKRRQDLANLTDILQRRLRGGQLNEEEVEELSYARRTADLVLSYGRQAIVAFQVKGVGPETGFRILGKMHTNDDDFYMDLLKAKIQFLRTRQFWHEKRSERY